MADYYQGGRTMSYGNSNTDDCYDAGRHSQGHGHGHGHGGRTPAMMYSNTTTDECYDAGGRHGHGGRPAVMYSNTTDECYDSGARHGHHGGGGAGRVYSHTTDVERYGAAEDDGCGGYGGAKQQYSEEYSRGGAGGGEQGYYYKKEEKTHKNRERVGELGALATGAFAMYEGYEAKKDPAHAQRHKIEAGLAGAAALGAGGYAYHEHREQKQASYGGAGAMEHAAYRMPQHNHCYN